MRGLDAGLLAVIPPEHRAALALARDEYRGGPPVDLSVRAGEVRATATWTADGATGWRGAPAYAALRRSTISTSSPSATISGSPVSSGRPSRRAIATAKQSA